MLDECLWLSAIVYLSSLMVVFFIRTAVCYIECDNCAVTTVSTPSRLIRLVSLTIEIRRDVSSHGVLAVVKGLKTRLLVSATETQVVWHY